MSGYKNGLQAKIKEKYPYAVFIHCLAHRLNLFVSDSCKNISTACSFFNAVESLYIHFSKPGIHSELKKISEKLKMWRLGAFVPLDGVVDLKIVKE